jgi:hypothetical protein
MNLWNFASGFWNETFLGLMFVSKIRVLVYVDTWTFVSGIRISIYVEAWALVFGMKIWVYDILFLKWNFKFMTFSIWH